MEKKFCEFGFWQSVRKLQKSYGKVLFYKTFFKKRNINRKQLIGSQDHIITKFGHKKKGEFGIGQSVRKLPEN